MSYRAEPMDAGTFLMPGFSVLNKCKVVHSQARQTRLIVGCRLKCLSPVFLHFAVGLSGSGITLFQLSPKAGAMVLLDRVDQFVE